MDITNTFAKARNANYVEPLVRPVVITDVPTGVAKLAIGELGMSEMLVNDPKTKWIDAETLACLDAAFDQGPFARVGKTCDVMQVVGPPGLRVASSGIHRIQGGALVTFGYIKN
ncbi:hypothetical protein [Rhodoferax antarcticus]|uniref:Uncharacterized protein n=1 Tax=Rhodoferax antarcticus ANT.BR TaxID=1111071 RepID=A0A1Q8Y926_9BURK|nr:hypothetical protein [Rhodoferax antarcticus]OLP04556.1 hypothetical protein BLL52_4260 [Rhodoferax antarcticus ANT.BR]